MAHFAPVQVAHFGAVWVAQCTPAEVAHFGRYKHGENILIETGVYDIILDLTDDTKPQYIVSKKNFLPTLNKD